jgi:predicted metalloprotease
MEDRRGQSSPLGGGLPIPIGKAGGGIGGLILIVVLALLFGGNITGGGSSGPLDPGGVDEPVPQGSSDTASGAAVKDNAFEFAKFVSQDTQDMWTQVSSRRGRPTHAPRW